MTIRPFTSVLRKQGFEFCWCDRSGGCKTTQFAKREGDRELHVQFWGDGPHRVSHGTYGQHGLRETTEPTSFSTVAEMLLALKLEWARPSREPGAPLSSTQRPAEQQGKTP